MERKKIKGRRVKVEIFAPDDRAQINETKPSVSAFSTVHVYGRFQGSEKTAATRPSRWAQSNCQGNFEYTLKM